MKMKQDKGPLLASIKECTGCMACADACRHGALKMQAGDDGHWYPMVDTDHCISCGACEKVCPVQNRVLYGVNCGRSYPMAAYCADKELIMQSASGGVFAAVATYVLQSGGYVVGAVSEGKEVRHIVIDSCADLIRLQGSKYLQSNTRGIYRQVKALLIKGHTVLFSGTGCQIAALRQFLGGGEIDRLFTIDLVCAGVPSNLLMSRFCKEEKLEPEYIRWRDKENGWRDGMQLRITSNGMEMRWKTQNCFLFGGFLGGMTSRWSCYNCRFTGTDRKADLTIGDYWGCGFWKDRQYDGVSVLVVHSDAGKELVEKSGVVTKLTTWKECTKKNPRIVLGERPFRWMLIERRIISWAFKHLGYDSLKKIYAGDVKKNDLLWLPYILFKFVRWKLTSFVTNKRVKGILNHL